MKNEIEPIKTIRGVTANSAFVLSAFYLVSPIIAILAKNGVAEADCDWIMAMASLTGWPEFFVAADADAKFLVVASLLYVCFSPLALYYLVLRTEDREGIDGKNASILICSSIVLILVGLSFLFNAPEYESASSASRSVRLLIGLARMRVPFLVLYASVVFLVVFGMYMIFVASNLYSKQLKRRK